MLGEGPAQPRGVLIGESPGPEEVLQGRPFVGPTGRELNRILTEQGLRRDRYRILNAILCQPTNKTAGSMKRAVNCCRPALIGQLEGLHDGIDILAMGKWAAYALNGPGKGVMNTRGFVREYTLRTLRKLERIQKRKHVEKIRKRRQKRWLTTRGSGDGKAKKSTN